MHRSWAALSAFKRELDFSQSRKERLRVENYCSPAILWDLPFLCFSWLLRFCDLFAAMGLHSRAFGEGFKSLEIMKRPFFSSCAVLRGIRWLVILLLRVSG